MSVTPLSRDDSAALAAAHGLRVVALEESGTGEPVATVNPLAAALLPKIACRQFAMLPISYQDGVLTIATVHPEDRLARELAAAYTGCELRWVVAAQDELARATERAFPPVSPIAGLDVESLVEAPTAPFTIPAPERLGEILLRRRLVTPEELAAAQLEQDHTGTRFGDVLVHNRLLQESDLISALAEQFQMPTIDLTTVDIDECPRDAIPEPLARRLRCVPIAQDEQVLYVAVADALDDALVEQLREHTTLDLRAYLASRADIDNLLQRIHRAAYSHVATGALLERFPDDCANRVITTAQRAFLVALAVVFVAALVVFPVPALIAAMAVSSIFYTATSLYKLRIIYLAQSHAYEFDITREEIEALDERDLPIYTILVPLYREAAVVPHLVRGIDGLDYPKSKLDVRLLCEEDDDETIPAIVKLNLPPHFRLVVVPDSQPKTKPKACNYGLIHCDGEIVVIYDAEDRPDPDQLKKAIVAFRRGDDSTTCIQAKLNYFNQRQNLLTSWFSIEYSMWFDLLLPGLDQDEVPIPLGGTSNHFLKERLVELAGWDPFNVTEDADLGIRLHKAGYQTAVIDSTTLEEANSVVSNWIRQRSRWIKGYYQTWLVHMRHPLRLMRQVGFKSWLSFQLVVGGSFLFLLNPIFWGLTTLFALTQAGVIQSLFPSFIFYLAALQLFVGNFAFLYLNLAGSVRRGYYELARYSLISPLYWGLMSIAAWKGFIQLFTNPFYWEKTEHGLDAGAEEG